jgi:agmatinase
MSVGPTRTPRFAGPATFAWPPRLDQVIADHVAVAVAPFDTGVSDRPGGRLTGIAAAHVECELVSAGVS